MVYVYSKNTKTGREDFVRRSFDTVKDAIEHIRLCYNIDKDIGALGEYFYFYKER